MKNQKMPTLAEKQGFWAEQLPNFEATYWLPSHFEFVAFNMDQGNYVIKDDLSPDFEGDATEIWHRVNTGWAMWKKAINYSRKQVQAVPEGFVLVPTQNIKYFSHDGDNYEVHDTLAKAKYEAECAIEHYRERLADQLSDPRSDGNFQDVGYGVVLAQSGYSIDHIVTQDDIDKGDYSFEVGTEILSLFLAEAQEQSHD